jgi:cytochrome c peroxidase
VWALIALSASALLAVGITKKAHADLPPDTPYGNSTLHYSIQPPTRRFDVDPALAAIGKQAFFDRSLSNPVGTACSDCHDPKQAFSGSHGYAGGVAAGAKPGSVGTRKVPSLLYVRYVPALYLYQDDDSPVPEAHGGLFVDGRVDSLDALPIAPLLNPLEMNNRDAVAVAEKVSRSAYASELKRVLGDAVLSKPKSAADALGRAIQAYLQLDEMAPFSSRYDAYIAGRGQLGDAEMRGLELFRNPDKGNCGACHLFNATSTEPTRSLFTDFGYEALAIPRNADIPANRDASYHDLGLCITARARKWPEPDALCGQFRTPSLRNVAVRQHYMHNGEFDDLRKVVSFYVTRSTEPGKWYPKGKLFDDLPDAMHRNVNINSSPYNRRVGSKPALNDSEINDVVAFLRTLTDAQYEPAASR